MPHINLLTPDVGFPHGSAGSESACNIRDSLHIGDRGSIPGQEDPLEKEMTTQSYSLPGKSCGQRSLVGYSPWGAESNTTE